MKPGSHLHRFWVAYDEWGYWDEAERPHWWPRWFNTWIGDHTFNFPPIQVWRPYCWLRRKHENDSYGACVYCRKALAPNSGSTSP